MDQRESPVGPIPRPGALEPGTCVAPDPKRSQPADRPERCAAARAGCMGGQFLAPGVTRDASRSA